MLSSTNPSELMSREASFGRFGSAIANMGDINKDGYDGEGLVVLGREGDPCCPVLVAVRNLCTFSQTLP